MQCRLSYAKFIDILGNERSYDNLYYLKKKYAYVTYFIFCYSYEAESNTCFAANG